MRISDWSSDVCSSDLWPSHGCCWRCCPWRSLPFIIGAVDCSTIGYSPIFFRSSKKRLMPLPPSQAESPTPCANSAGLRSEEHTSELQSLMRISYAVFCLKKKNNDRRNKHTKPAHPKPGPTTNAGQHLTRQTHSRIHGQ